MTVKSRQVSTLCSYEGRMTSFNSSEFELDTSSGATIGLYVTFGIGLSANAKVQASIDKLRWVDLDGTEQITSANDNYMWVLSDLGGIRFLRLSVTIAAGIADFEANCGT